MTVGSQVTPQTVMPGVRTLISLIRRQKMPATLIEQSINVRRQVRTAAAR